LTQLDQDRRDRHDQLMWEAGAEAREKERRRKELAASERARLAATRDSNLPSDKLPRPQPGPKPGKDRSAVRTDAQQSAHNTWVDPSEREGRRQEGEAKQKAAAGKAAAERNAAISAATREAEIKQGKRQAERHMHAPAPLSLGAFVQKPQARLKTLRDWRPPKAEPPSPAEEDGRSVMSVATTNVALPIPSNHAVDRAAEHGLTKRQVQHTIKHGAVERSADGTENAPRYVHRGPAGGVDVVTNATGEVAITVHPARASQARERERASR
jgi:hypothetical protein